MRVSRPRIDECTYDWCNRETRELAGTACPAVFQHPIAQSGSADTPSWVQQRLAQGRVCGESRESARGGRFHGGPICKRSRTSRLRGTRPAAAQMPAHLQLSQPLCIGGDFASKRIQDTMYLAQSSTRQLSLGNSSHSFEFCVENKAVCGKLHTASISG